MREQVGIFHVKEELVFPAVHLHVVTKTFSLRSLDIRAYILALGESPDLH